MKVLHRIVLNFNSLPANSTTTALNSPSTVNYIHLIGIQPSQSREEPLIQTYTNMNVKEWKKFKSASQRIYSELQAYNDTNGELPNKIVPIQTE